MDIVLEQFACFLGYVLVQQTDSDVYGPAGAPVLSACPAIDVIKKTIEIDSVWQKQYLLFVICWNCPAFSEQMYVHPPATVIDTFLARIPELMNFYVFGRSIKRSRNSRSRQQASTVSAAALTPLETTMRMMQDLKLAYYTIPE